MDNFFESQFLRLGTFRKLGFHGVGKVNIALERALRALRIMLKAVEDLGSISGL